MNGELRPLGIADEELLPLRRDDAPPACDGVVVDRAGRVGDHQPRVYPDDLAEALALGAGSDGVVEAKHLGAWLLEDPAVGLEDVAKGL